MITAQVEPLLFVICVLFVLIIFLMIIVYKQNYQIWEDGNTIRELRSELYRVFDIDVYPSPEKPDRYYADLDGGIRVVIADGDIYWYRYDEPAPIEFKVGKTKSKGAKR